MKKYLRITYAKGTWILKTQGWKNS